MDDEEYKVIMRDKLSVAGMSLEEIDAIVEQLGGALPEPVPINIDFTISTDPDDLTRLIVDTQDQVVGKIETLQDGDYSVTFHDVWMGVYHTFSSWNCQHGGIYAIK